MRTWLLLMTEEEKMSESPPLLLTVQETARLLRIQRAKVYLLIESGAITAVKVGSAWRVRTISRVAARE